MQKLVYSRCCQYFFDPIHEPEYLKKKHCFVSTRTTNYNVSLFTDRIFGVSQLWTVWNVEKAREKDVSSVKKCNRRAETWFLLLSIPTVHSLSINSFNSDTRNCTNIKQILIETNAKRYEVNSRFYVKQNIVLNHSAIRTLHDIISAKVFGICFF